MPIESVIETLKDVGESYPLGPFFRNGEEIAKKLMCIGTKINKKTLEILQEQQLLLVLLDIFKEDVERCSLAKFVKNALIQHESFSQLDTYMSNDAVKGSPNNQKLCFAISKLLDLSQLKYEKLFREKQSSLLYDKDASQLFPSPKETPYAQAKNSQSYKNHRT